MLGTKAGKQNPDIISKQDLLWMSIGREWPSAVRGVEYDLRADKVH